MAMIKLALLYSMLASLSVQELRDVYGFTRLDLPWVLVELVLWAMIYRRGLNFGEVRRMIWQAPMALSVQWWPYLDLFAVDSATSAPFDLSYVELGNILGGRSAVLALLAWAVGGMPVLEQPLRSVMTALPAWQSVIAYFDEAEQLGWIGQRLKLNQVFMACFKAPTLKPTALYSTESFDPLMNMKVPPNTRYQDASGAKRVQGGPGLKQTQLYTPEFGRALASWWMAHGPVSAGRERRRWCLVQSSNVSADIMKERIAAYSRLQHFDFSEGRLQEALEELRCSNANSFRHV
ncbi:unnamed protein product [Cladocopium goreaui]|uniref:Uncharacterized protein n=1 Tax=Cladocopium goreaui TaxID=2562237 RepID=A0A9P1LZE1_9DINO|nr:unnamed protein product [Cladocopium goreaui]